MSYLVMPSAPTSFNECVFSVWFKVSADSINQVKAKWAAASVPDTEVNYGDVLPFFTYGLTGYYNYFPSSYSTKTYPSFFGLRYGLSFPDYFSANPPEEGLWLAARMQYLDHGSVDVEWGHPGAGQQDFSMPDCYSAGGFLLAGQVGLGGPEQVNLAIPVTPDVWHHLLVSFDLSPGSTGIILDLAAGTAAFGTVSKFWWALDDTNRHGQEIAPYSEQCFYPFSGDPNGIVSAFCMFNQYYPGMPGEPLPVAGNPIGIPSTPDHIGQVYHCELAELQLFTDVHLDTSVVANRRAFVTAKGKPANPRLAEDLLGKRPEILLHGTANWQAGRNTGSWGVDSRGQTIPTGQFTPTGRIKPYKPDPKLV
jgi:hypothetical protein